MAFALAGRFASCHRIFPSTEGLPSTTRPYGICFKCLPQSRSALTLRSFSAHKKTSGAKAPEVFCSVMNWRLCYMCASVTSGVAGIIKPTAHGIACMNSDDSHVNAAEPATSGPGYNAFMSKHRLHLQVSFLVRLKLKVQPDFLQLIPLSRCQFLNFRVSTGGFRKLIQGGNVSRKTIYHLVQFSIYTYHI